MCPSVGKEHVPWRVAIFPFEPDQFAPLNRWYVAAFGREVGRQPIERWFCEEPVAFYRSEGGMPVDGRCSHHMFPLAQGSLVGDNIRCGYHGLVFAPVGGCAASPFLNKIPAACRIRAYPVAERWQWIWIWPGDPARADPATIPDHGAIGLDNPAYDTLPGDHYELAAHYQLIIENLLDLQHVEVLHSKHIGSGGFGLFNEKVEIGADSVQSNRVLRNVTVPPVMAAWFGAGTADRTVDMRFLAPVLHVGADIFTGAPGSERDREHLGRINVCHAVTPARRHSCHYFTAIGRDFARGDAAFDDGMRHKLREVVAEDVVAAEAIEAMLGKTAAPREMLFRPDATLVAGRRMLQRMIRDECATAGMPAILEDSLA